jgi:hypothetical protein
MGGLRASVLAVGEVMSRFDEFEDALRKLCVEHKVSLSVSSFEDLVVEPLGEGGDPLEHLDMHDGIDPRPPITIYFP